MSARGTASLVQAARGYAATRGHGTGWVDLHDWFDDGRVGRQLVGGPGRVRRSQPGDGEGWQR